MIHLHDSNHILRDVSMISVKKDGVLRSAYVLKAKVNGELRIIWIKTEGYIFTSDNYAVCTSDGYMVACSDQ